ISALLPIYVLLAEALNTACGVDQLLLPRIKRVALVADVCMDLSLGRARLERIAARALDRGGVVLGMNAGFHEKLLVIGCWSWVVGWGLHFTDHLSPTTDNRCLAGCEIYSQNALTNNRTTACPFDT